MIYQSSQSASDGAMILTVTFALGTDLDKAQVQVQNRVAQALPKLPQEVQRIGVTTDKASPDLTLVVHMISPNNRYDMLYLSNYAQLNVRDRLKRVDGVGDVQIFGAGAYSMRVWLDPEKLASLNMTAGDVVEGPARAERPGRRRPAGRPADQCRAPTSSCRSTPPAA